MSPANRSRLSILTTLVRAELGTGLAGLSLFIAAVALGTAMLALVWLIGAGAGDAFERNGRQIVGGDIELEVPALPLEPGIVEALNQIGAVSTVVDMRSTVRLDAAQCAGGTPRRGTLPIHSMARSAWHKARSRAC